MIMKRTFAFSILASSCFFLPSGEANDNQDLSQVSMEILGPKTFEVDPPKNNFYLHCKATNNGKEPATFIPRARIMLKNKAGKTERLKSYTAGVFNETTLKPGESVTWWQHSIAPGIGTLDVHLKGYYHSEIISKPGTVTLTASPLLGREVKTARDALFQKRLKEFPEVIPGTDPNNIKFQVVTFDKDPINFHGSIYHCIRFKAPKTGGHMLWSFVLEDTENNQLPYFILPAKGSFHGFTHFHDWDYYDPVPGHANRGDTLVTQNLDASEIKPEEEYIIWFQGIFRELKSLRLSINFSDTYIHPNKYFKKYRK